MKANSKVGKVVTIQLVDDTTEMMVISQFGKIIRIDTKSVRAAGRSTSRVRFLNLESDDRVRGGSGVLRMRFIPTFGRAEGISRRGESARVKAVS
jgi:DNA gyrase/topoisomerase IV subunit A